MNKTNSLLMTLLILCSTTLNFATENDDNRYKTIVQSFSRKTNNFIDGFVRNDGDIEIIQNHKKLLEYKLALYKASWWTPTSLKLLATGFGISAGLSALDVINQFLPDNIDIFTNRSLRLFYYFLTRINPNPTFFLVRALRNQLSYTQRNALYSITDAAVAKYLLNTAVNYKNIISELEENIELDDKIIKSLGNQKK